VPSCSKEQCCKVARGVGRWEGRKGEVKKEGKKEVRRVRGKVRGRKEEEGRSFLSGCSLGEGRRMKDKKVRPRPI